MNYMYTYGIPKQIKLNHGIVRGVRNELRDNENNIYCNMDYVYTRDQ